MTTRMMIDARHPEETRVAVVKGNRIEDFDFEAADRKQLKGNIYLAKVTRVEPSLQAAFVDYGGNRHGFLAFSEIHPDYYQIPAADRAALIAEERAYAEAQEAEDAARAKRRHARAQKAETGDETVSAEVEDGEVADPLDAVGGDHPGGGLGAGQQRGDGVAGAAQGEVLQPLADVEQPQHRQCHDVLAQ